MQTNAKPDAEGDAFFLDSEDDPSSEEAAATSAEPAAAVAVPRSNWGHAEVSASQAQQGTASTDIAQQEQTGTAQQAQKGRTQQGQKSRAWQAKSGAASKADGTTGSVAVQDQPSAKRQALASSQQIMKAAAKRVRTSSTADVCGSESAQQYPQHDRPLVLQPSHQAVQHIAQAQPMPSSTSAKSNKHLDRPAKEVGSARPQYTARSLAVSAANKVMLSRKLLICLSQQDKYA